MARKTRDFAPQPEPLPVAVVDNHTHIESISAVLAGEVTDPGISGHLIAAAEAGVGGVVQIGCDLDSAVASLDLARRHDPGQAQVVAGVALHPNEVVDHQGVVETAPDGLEAQPLGRHQVSYADALARIAELARDDRVRTISETGLDYFRAGQQGRQLQRDAFRDHIALAKELDLPLQIHDRDAHADVLAALDADGAPERTIIHSFSGDAEFAQACIERGLYLSFSGVVTFNSAQHLRDAARIVPIDQILVETDAPYLTPHPHRGRPNSPYYLP